MKKKLVYLKIRFDKIHALINTFCLDYSFKVFFGHRSNIDTEPVPSRGNEFGIVVNTVLNNRFKIGRENRTDKFHMNPLSSFENNMGQLVICNAELFKESVTEKISELGGQTVVIEFHPYLSGLL